MLTLKEEGNVSFLFMESGLLSGVCLKPDAAFNRLFEAVTQELPSSDYWFMSK